MEYLPTLFKIFVFLVAPFIVWPVVTRLLRRRGMSGRDSQALGVAAGAVMMLGALAFIASTTPRLADLGSPPPPPSAQPR